MKRNERTADAARTLSGALFAAALLAVGAAPALAQSAPLPSEEVSAAEEPKSELEALRTEVEGLRAALEEVKASKGRPVAEGGAAEVTPSGQNTIVIRGFINAVGFTQDAAFGFGNGGNSAWVTTAPDGHKWMVSGDVRASRLAFDLRGPPIGGGWTANGTLEMDFFGGFTTSGPTADEQPVPRLRTAFADLTRGGTTLRLGQFWNPLFGYVPATVSQLAFPPGIGSAGLIGWRFPGIFVYQNLTPSSARTRAQLQLAALRGSWDGPGSNIDHLSAGETSAFPQVQARLDLNGRAGGVPWGAYLVGHYDRKDMRGYGITTMPDGAAKTIEGTAVQVGMRAVPGPLTLHGNVYRGRAIGQNLGHITQFGDIAGWGGWTQAGYAFSRGISAWFFYGIDNPDDADIRAIIPTPADQPGLRQRGARLQNQRYTGMLRYTSGPYQIGLEWLRAETDWAVRTFGSPEIQTQRRTGNQMALGVLYSF
jgi:hypothetical protein